MGNFIVFLVARVMRMSADAEEDGHVDIPMLLMKSLLLILTMIPDAMHISQTAKIFLATLASSWFASAWLERQHQSFHRSDIYHDLDYETPSLFGFDPITFNLIDLGMNAAQVLTLFSLKQLYAAIREPDKGAIIKITPLIIYKDSANKEKKPSNSKLRMALIALICWLGVVFMVGVVQIVRGAVSG